MAINNLVLLDVDAESGVATITLNNPSSLNPLSAAMSTAFAQAVDTVCSRVDSIGCVVLTGAGRAFSAGGDLDFLEDRAFRSSPEINTETMRGFYAGFLEPLQRLPMPVIAAVNGHAIGAAFALAMATDIRIISETAKCSVNFTQLGLHPGMGATFTLPRTVRREVSNYLLLTGRQIQGLEALELGLCLKSVPADQVLAVATEIARDIASNGRLAVRQTKESLDSQFREGMGRQLRREADAQAVSYVGPDFQDRLTDLIAKTTGKNRPKSKL